MFTWVPMYKEISAKLQEFKNNQQDLIKILNDLHDQGLPTISLVEKDSNGAEIALSEIDPFTFFANFNRNLKEKNRIEIIKIIKEKWNLKSDLPNDFSGLPVVNSQRAWFFRGKTKRGEQDIKLLWDLFVQAIGGEIDSKTFDSVLKLKFIKYNITMGLFWIDPVRYLNLDKVNRTYLRKAGITIKDLPDFDSYKKFMENVRSKYDKPFYEISNDAWNYAKDEDGPDDDTEDDDDAESQKTWLYAPGRGGKYWEDFYLKGIMAIGWDYLGDLSKYITKLEIADAMRDHDKDPKSSKKNNANSCFSFCHSMRAGDYVFAKIGTAKIVGWGIINSDYLFDPTREVFKHVRRVDWKAKGKWTVSGDKKFALKTITNITKYSKFVQYLHSLVETGEVVNSSIQHWWLNANPKIWDLGAPPVGTKETYTSHNAKGNKRRVYQYFSQVKPGDILLGYISSPLRQISALCKVTKGLHPTPEGEAFEFEKIEQFLEPVSFSDLQSVAGLEKCEPLINNQGSLFKLKPEEYEIIRSIIDEANEIIEGSTDRESVYSIEECSKAIGYSLNKISSWKGAIERKRQAVFYGPPGTGKTFIAQHLAKHIVGGSDGIIGCIQFHPAYTYEEFIQGIRPGIDDQGKLQFKLKPGRFLEFCAKARTRKGPCVQIIDELNRANIPRVFGELMYLLEYREKDMPLAGGTRFSIPKNVLIIGTMNTADRSIALVDFALRRRFAFFELFPEYEVLKTYQLQRDFNPNGLVRALQDINTKINDKNFHLGISFFMVDELAAKLEDIWKMEIETYLEEYFFSQPEIVSNFRWDKLKDKLTS